MANKILAGIGLSPLNKFLLVYWFSLGAIVFDQIITIQSQWIPILTGTPMKNLDGSIAGTITFASEPMGMSICLIATLAILYGAYLLYNKQKRGAQIAIVANIVNVGYFTLLVAPNYNFSSVTTWFAVYLITFIIVVGGPVYCLFPEEYN